ncbi:MAG: 5-(carboxyamino)imidazole ribonucleotide synthase [Defluviitaleaceae bacterium]|nr:5-(carboxyamino)imidazole ribonucleotide synthase [Defluviitaleaceae bacterium]MCL2263229.1 5-(carboxyamino)imidazole ribonucleotide synthase [Defluviitaleaceae bacterium]
MKIIQPYQTIGIMGGGQLARMMCIAAKAMGYKTAVLDPTPNCPAGQVADIEITAAYDDIEAAKKLAEVSDVITYEFENVHYTALAELEKIAYLPQGSEVLKICQHRYTEKKTISDMGIKVADFRLIEKPEDLENIEYPCVIKTTRGGYDGKGQMVLRSAADLPAAKELAAQAECVLEKFVPFSKEISVIVARSTTGETEVFPVSENIHVNSILHQCIVPARISPALEKEAIDCARKIAENLGATGVLGIEMFVVDDRIVINEIAPRPHNSGHYTIDACVTSQFEQHIRAVCGLPLAETTLHTPVIMVNILGNHLDKNNLHNLAPYHPLLRHGKIHLYGKAEAVNGRKMGHINLLGSHDEVFKLVDESGIWV